MAGFTDTAGSLKITDGTVSAPGLAFSSETGTGIYYNSNNSGSISIARNGVQQVNIFDNTAGGSGINLFGNWIPFTDANVDFGQNSSGPVQVVFSVNGTVQTSHSDFKTDIQELTYMTVPPGVQFRYKDSPEKPHIGWLADDMPKEAYEWDKDGNIIKSSVSTSAVIGILCTSVRNLQKRVVELKQELQTLKGL